MAGYEPTTGRTVALCCVVCESTFDHTTKSKGRYPASPPGAQRRAPVGKRTLHELTCAQCNKHFKALDPKRKCCGQECGRRWAKVRQNEWRARRAEERNTRTCQSCGVTFRRQRASDTGKYCSKRCVADARRKYASSEEARKAGKRRARDRRRASSGLDQAVPCAGCEKPFERKHTGQRFCSSGCAKPAQTHRPRRCKACDIEFTPAHGRAQYCSPSCARRAARLKFGKRHRQRARYHGVPYEPVDRLKVFERDAWTCQVCGKKAPRRWQGSFRDNAPELDHRTPMALGGAHSYENCQLACRRCNLAKAGSRIVGQMPLFAHPQ